MKKYFLLFVIPVIFVHVYAQPIPDSVLQKYHAATAHVEKAKILWTYLRTFSNDTNDLQNTLAVYDYFKKQNDDAAADFTQIYLAGRIIRRGDYATGLNMSLSLFASCEKRKDTIGIIFALRKVSNSYEFANNFDQAVAWNKKSLPYTIALNDQYELANTYNDIGAVYAKAMMPDSGLIYAQQAVAIDMKMNNTDNLPFSLGTLSENYIAQNNFDLAIPFSRKALLYAKANNDHWALAFTYLDFSQAYFGLKNYDSAIYYAHNSIYYSTNYKETLLKSLNVLYNSYAAINKSDSMLKYLVQLTQVKDSVYSIEKTNNAQAITFREQLRQQQLDQEKAAAAEEQKTNIQYAAIGAGILIFISIFLLLSRSIIVNEKWISFLGILGLLLVFEFINLFTHPFLEDITGHSPVLMLLALVAIGSLLIPLHHKLEHWIKNKMVEKNKKIRLQAAKKTIEELENKGE